MSQAKVDAYKAEKKNRKQNLKKEKRKKLFWKIFGPILAIIVIAGIGAIIYFVPKLTNDQKEAQTADEVDYSELINMLQEQGVDVTTSDDATSDAAVTDSDSSDTNSTDATDADSSSEESAE